MCVPLQVHVIVSVHVLNTIPWAAFPAITFHIRQPQVERLGRREKCSSLWRERIVWKWRGDVSLFAGKWILLPWNLTRNSVDSCVWKNRKIRNKRETEERGQRGKIRKEWKLEELSNGKNCEIRNWRTIGRSLGKRKVKLDNEGNLEISQIEEIEDTRFTRLKSSRSRHLEIGDAREIRKLGIPEIRKLED